MKNLLNNNIFRKYNKLSIKILIVFLVPFFILLLNFGISKATGFNPIGSGIKKLLNASGTYTEQVTTTELKSDGYDNKVGGAWKIKKFGLWSGLNQARYDISVETIPKSESTNYRDVILVLDTSSSMNIDGKLSYLKEGTINLVNTLLADTNNKVSIITYNGTATILSNFTNNKSTLTTSINSITTGNNSTNYNAALLKVGELLQNYKKVNNRDLVTVFLTDGNPTTDTPNEVGQYDLLKDKYPYMEINGIQYNMGTTISKKLADITDKQYWITGYSLVDGLVWGAMSPTTYDTFTVVEYIDSEYWTVNSADDIKVENGTVKLENESGKQKITWTFDKGTFITGARSGMRIDLSLKSKYQGVTGFYPINGSGTVTYKLPNATSKSNTSTKKIVLQSGYNVNYDTNLPKECGKSTVTTEKHYAFEKVKLKSAPTACDGYTFKGWEFNTKWDGKTIEASDNTFSMPYYDVSIKAVWTKASIVKSMEGTVKEKLTLYQQVEKDAKNGKYALKYTGKTDTFKGNKQVYYYTPDADNNMVMFADKCWKMIRTTDTGGVKLLAYGVWGYNSCTSVEFKDVTDRNFTGVAEYDSLPTSVGYMYDSSAKYAMDSIPLYSNNQQVFFKVKNYKDSPDTPIKVAGVDSVTYNNQYRLPEDSETYTLSTTPTMAYSCLNDETSCSTIAFITYKDDTNIYYMELRGGQVTGDQKITFSKTISGDHTSGYTLVNPTTYPLDSWHMYRTSLKDAYYCDTLGETTCNAESLKKITDTSITGAKVKWVEDSAKYGNSFSWDGTNYTLTNTKTPTTSYLSERSSFTNNHYTCYNESGKCKELYYVYKVVGSGNSYEAHYIKLTGGQSVNDALNKMLHSTNVNKDSLVKTKVDEFFFSEFVNANRYAQYMEDTVWCNNKDVSDFGGWNPNGGSLDKDLKFSSDTNDLTCKNPNDRFTVNTSNGNGKLKYPIGTLTYKEMELSYPSSFTEGMVSMSPASYNDYIYGSSYNRVHYQYGSIWYNYLSSSSGGFRFRQTPMKQYPVQLTDIAVRPAISLKDGISFKSGDGSASNPYIIDVDS